MKDNKIKKIFVAGHNGMVGSSLLRNLNVENKNNKLIVKSKDELNLTNQQEVSNFLITEKPDEVYIAAAKVGGIYANSKYPAEFIYNNLMISTNLINLCFENNIKKILFLGSSCIYPKFSQQPIKEEYLLSGTLEETNEAYAISKIAGIKLCEAYNKQYFRSHDVDYRAVMPTNLYGIGDKYDDKNSHVIPALIKRFHKAKIKNENNVKIWGSGNAKREFLFVDDLAIACIKVMNLTYNDYKSITENKGSFINVGSGSEVTIKELAETISEVVGYNGNLIFDTNMPDGTPRKLLDSNKIKNLGWKPKYNLLEGLKITYEDYLKNTW